MIKIGVFGGAFNPIHNGHINMVKEAFTDLKLQTMLIIPTCVSPHKSNKGLIAFEDRAKMCELAFAKEIEEGKFEISDIEKRIESLESEKPDADVTARTAIPIIENVLERYHTLNAEGKNKLLKSIVKSVVYTNVDHGIELDVALLV